MECTGNWTSRTQKSSYRAKLAEIEAAIAAGSAGHSKRRPASGSARRPPSLLTIRQLQRPCEC
jgi:hypothetical protein